MEGRGEAAPTSPTPKIGREQGVHSREVHVRPMLREGFQMKSFDIVSGSLWMDA